jgi:uncharacterized membrane protein
MIQFNLLPDVKLQYVKARKLKHAVITISILVAAGSLAVLVLLFGIVNGLQRTHLNNLNNDIAKKSSELKEKPDLDKILTIQNQLNNLTPLHEQKHQASRLQQFVSQITPVQATFAEFTINFDESTMKITGAADSLLTVNQFIDTIKFTKYTIVAEGESAESAEQFAAFKDVVLTSFDRNEEGASYEIDLKFDPLIFDNKNTVALVVPEIITTRSVTERPDTTGQTDDLFQPLPDDENEAGRR